MAAIKNGELDVKHYMLRRIGGKENYDQTVNFTYADALPTSSEPTHVKTAKNTIAKWENEQAVKASEHKAKVIQLRISAREAVYTSDMEKAYTLVHELEALLIGTKALD